MLKNVFFALALVTTAFGSGEQLTEDNGLKQACEQMKGEFQAREGKDSIVGDKCILTYNVATRDDQDAREFCELYAPWRLEKAERKEESQRSFVECHVEATMTCEAGWTQMFGYCFKMPEKLATFTYSEGVEKCKDEHDGAEIAFMHHRYISGVWRRYFSGVAQIWVRATETFHKYIVPTNTVDGEALALAFTGRHFEFNVPANALIRIDPNLKLQLLCQYKPPMTAAEINYLGRRYSEIYYPSVPVDHGILVRSSSSYTSSTVGLDVCRKVLKPFLTDTVGPFVPDQETLDAISEKTFPLVHLTRSGAEARIDFSFLELEGCQHVSNRFEVLTPEANVGNFVIPNVTDTVACDHMKSSAITHFKGSKSVLKVMSDSRSLPIWCKLGRQPKFTFSTPSPGYEIFQRSKSDAISHKLYTDKVTYEEAQARCKKDGGFVSGINSEVEAQFLGSLATKANEIHLSYWLGGKRRKECEEENGYKEGETHACARNNVIQWQNGVATKFYTDWWRDGADKHKNPSSTSYHKQFCLVYVHGIPDWSANIPTSFLDDVECDDKKGFFCSKIVEVLKEDY